MGLELDQLESKHLIKTQAELKHVCPLWLNRKQTKLGFTRTPKRKEHALQIIRSVLGNRKSGIDSSDNGATEPTRILLERLFAQTQKMEEQMSRDSSLPPDIQLGFNLEILESDLQAVLAALRKKEEDLQDAERVVLLEHAEIKRTKQELEQREEEIVAARSKQEKLEEDLKQANHDLASQVRQIEDLKLLVKERDQEIVTTQSALSLKEGDLDKLRNELTEKSKEAAKTESNLKSRDHLLNEANGIIKKQEAEVQELRMAFREKEQELEASVTLRKLEEEKLKLAETKLEKRTVDWLSAQEELKTLAEEASKRMGETNETLEDFRRVKKLLADVRSELVSSQKSLASSRLKMEDQEHQLEKQLAELEEQKFIVMSYITSLKDANIEVESERAKLRVAEARNKELEWDLSMEKELMDQLQTELNKERSYLELALQEKSVLLEELEQKTSEFGEAHNLLQFKESELVEARLQIQQLTSRQASFQVMLEEKDTDLSNARKKLEEANKEVAELKLLMKSREEQLIQATAILQEKEDHGQIMQHELDDTKLKFSEAATVVERIADLTNKLVISMKDEENALIPFDEESTLPEMEHELVHYLLDADDLNKLALSNLADMSRELLKKAILTERLVKEAGTMSELGIYKIIPKSGVRRHTYKMEIEHKFAINQITASHYAVVLVRTAFQLELHKLLTITNGSAKKLLTKPSRSVFHCYKLHSVNCKFGCNTKAHVKHFFALVENILRARVYRAKESTLTEQTRKRALFFNLGDPSTST
ncbi:hypothetical protein HHK36_021407 [Tetracentron sinense]|uniref:Uncharacterized protein n=1 Tax=Tetracentron sinense TaxID=13715 RepID=A0A835D7T3_TETSI|nr:hypothetical protein HHK36_021407 [Tetracentron sinense]